MHRCSMTVLFQMSLPKRLWAKDVRRTCFLSRNCRGVLKCELKSLFTSSLARDSCCFRRDQFRVSPHARVEFLEIVCEPTVEHLSCFSRRALYVDEDECLSPGICQHKCRNTWGSFVCSCYTGYKVAADGRTCEGE